MKKRLLMLILAMAFCMTGCAEDEIEKETLNYADAMDDGEDVKELTYDEIVNYVEFGKPHLYIELMDGLTVDADVTTNYPDEVGIYEYTYASSQEEDVEVTNANADKLAALVDYYYGSDVTTTLAEEQAIMDTTGEEVSANIYCWNGYMCYAGDIMNKNFYMDACEIYYPELNGEYDEEMINGVVEDFKTHFAEVLPENLSSEYRCVHFNQEYLGQLLETYGFNPFDAVNKDFYIVRIYSILEDIVFKDGDSNIFTDGIGETSFAEPYIYSEGSVSGESLRRHEMDAFVDILIDEDGKIFGFQIEESVKAGQCVETREVIRIKEAVEKLYDLYKQHTIYTDIVVKKISLQYMVTLEDTVDENGYRAAYLQPVWYFQYHKKNAEMCEEIIFSATTGALIHRD